MEVILWFLSNGPDNVHILIRDVMIGEGAGLQLLPEQHGRLSVALEGECGGQVVLATPEGVDARRGPVTGVVVEHAGGVTPGHADDHVGAVHGVELAAGSVVGDAATGRLGLRRGGGGLGLGFRLSFRLGLRLGFRLGLGLS